jgi:hypothetical protein
VTVLVDFILEVEPVRLSCERSVEWV